MGRSTNGGTCYGVPFDEDYPFPWDDDKYDNDVCEWWAVKTQGHDKELPVAVVNYCSSKVPMMIIAVPSSVNTYLRSHPEEFIPEELITSEDEREKLIAFCVKYLQAGAGYYDFPEMEPKWYLSSYTD